MIVWFVSLAPKVSYGSPLLARSRRANSLSQSTLLDYLEP